MTLIHLLCQAKLFVQLDNLLLILLSKQGILMDSLAPLDAMIINDIFMVEKSGLKILAVGIGPVSVGLEHGGRWRGWGYSDCRVESLRNNLTGNRQISWRLYWPQGAYLYRCYLGPVSNRCLQASSNWLSKHFLIHTQTLYLFIVALIIQTCSLPACSQDGTFLL